MGVFEALLEKLEKIEKALERLEAADNIKPVDDCFISPVEAGKLLGCGKDVIKALQDAGYLSLCFKPSIPKPGKAENQSKHRLVLKSEVLEMQKKSIAKPAKKKK